MRGCGRKGVGAAHRLFARKTALSGKTLKQSSAGKSATMSATVRDWYACQLRLHAGSTSLPKKEAAARPSAVYMRKVAASATPKTLANSLFGPRGCNRLGTPIWNN